MDNTDGLGQTLTELAEHSSVRFLIEQSRIRLPHLVTKIANLCNLDPLTTALSPGADSSLVGTLTGVWTEDTARATFGEGLQIIGRVQSGHGVFVEANGTQTALTVSGTTIFETD